MDFWTQNQSSGFLAVESPRESQYVLEKKHVTKRQHLTANDTTRYMTSVVGAKNYTFQGKKHVSLQLNGFY